MKKASRKTLFVFIAAFALTSVACLNGIAEDSIEKSFQVKPGGQLILGTDLGSIEINTSNINTLKIEVIREVRTASSGRAQEILEDFDISFRQDGNTVYVNGEYERSGLRKLLSHL